MELGDDGAEAPRWSLEAATRFVDGKIADFFAALGALCARRPKKVLAVSVGAPRLRRRGTVLSDVERLVRRRLLAPRLALGALRPLRVLRRRAAQARRAEVQRPDEELGRRVRRLPIGL